MSPLHPVRPAYVGHESAPLPASPDTPGLSAHDLQQSFGRDLGEAVLRELAVDPAPDVHLHALDAHRALEMGESARTALRGVDFCTRLTHSASAGGPGFRRVALGLGLDPGDIDAATRRSIDFRMAYRFDSAAEAGQSPVPLSKAEEWLQNELLLLTK